MRLNPHYPDFYVYTLGLAYRLTGQYPEAIAALQETISRNPNFQPAYFHLIASYVQQWAFQQMRMPRRWRRRWQRRNGLSPQMTPTSEGHLILGFVYLWQKQYEQAVAELERTVTLDPNLAEGYAGLAEALSRVGKPQEAVERAAQALRRKSFATDNQLDSVGAAYALAGKPEEAIAPLQQYLSHYPNILGAHLTLVAVYSELGREAARREPSTSPNLTDEVKM